MKAVDYDPEFLTRLDPTLAGRLTVTCPQCGQEKPLERVNPFHGCEECEAGLHAILAEERDDTEHIIIWDLK